MGKKIYLLYAHYPSGDLDIDGYTFDRSIAETYEEGGVYQFSMEIREWGI